MGETCLPGWLALLRIQGIAGNSLPCCFDAEAVPNKFAARASEFSQSRVSGHSQHCLGKTIAICGFDKESVVAIDRCFFHAARACRHDRQPAAIASRSATGRPSVSELSTNTSRPLRNAEYRLPHRGT